MDQPMATRFYDGQSKLILLLTFPNFPFLSLFSPEFNSRSTILNYPSIYPADDWVGPSNFALPCFVALLCLAAVRCFPPLPFLPFLFPLLFAPSFCPFRLPLIPCLSCCFVFLSPLRALYSIIS
ncbi:hypothetical protein BZA05DRAFT_9274 [Tricharina praecox]|uniref:uncharacterized protein n=1 Tax=Tricharina praecox TaxID=43433 RepID=UPI00221F450A|nr:uncharacterized protein BZA05DRAFT_9274 [Tricharina praecox]KAI5858629.1 hypothetical protein BZA05DRAFT_9274 [Tricharina praecox]